MNAENILKVADAIERHSIPWLGFNVRTWYGDVSDPMNYVDNSGHDCGTVACVAGWATAVELGEDVVKEEFDIARSKGGLFRQDLLSSPEEFLGLTERDAESLFYGADISTTADQAVRTLRHLAATGEVDWSV